ncbi:unnamed protein product, partial [Prunus brigantina]
LSLSVSLPNKLIPTDKNEKGPRSFQVPITLFFLNIKFTVLMFLLSTLALSIAQR